MAFASGKKRGTRAVSRTASRPPQKQTNRRRKKARKAQRLQALLSKNLYTRRVYGWYEQEKEKRADSPLLLVTVMLLAAWAAFQYTTWSWQSV